MNQRLGTCPLTQEQLIEEYFLEHRTKILDLAAFLDRLDRSATHDGERDFRLVAMREALTVLTSASPAPDRAERVQLALSDHTHEPLDTRDRQGAYGASVR